MLTTPLNEREVKWAIGRTDFLVGSRMHACIAALSQCIPTVGLAYSDKFFGVFDSAGVAESIIDLRCCEAPEVIARVMAAFSGRDSIARRLRASVPTITEAIVGAFRELLPVETRTNGAERM
jgi:polysaccharide pyruvyl transferase WcaK-like protein